MIVQPSRQRSLEHRRNRNFATMSACCVPEGFLVQPIQKMPQVLFGFSLIERCGAILLLHGQGDSKIMIFCLVLQELKKVRTKVAGQV